MAKIKLLDAIQQLLLGYLLHGLGLGSGSDAGDGETDVDGGPDALVEELGLQEDLAVSDGDDVGGNVGRHVTSLKKDMNSLVFTSKLK